MPNISLVASKISVSAADGPVLSDVSIAVANGERLGVVGPNGAGKSTLLSVLAGLRQPESGHVIRTPRDAGLALIKQELAVRTPVAVLPYITEQSGVTAAEQEFRAAADAMATTYNHGTAERYSRALARWEQVGAADFAARADTVLADVGIDDLVDSDVTRLSGGEQARVQLALTLLSRASILLLDEPTNDLDLAGLALLEDKVLSRDLAVVVVSHDRAFLERVATSVLELDDHTREARVYSVPWSEYLVESKKARARAQAAYAKVEEQQARLKERMRREQEWAERGQRSASAAKARDGDKLARKKAASGSQSRVGQARREADRLATNVAIEKPWSYWELRLSLTEADRVGDVVARMRDVVWTRDKMRLGPLNLEIHAGDRIKLLGSNGRGKTTVLRLLLGELQPDTGSIYLGPTVRLGVLDQARMLGQRPDVPALDAAVALAGVPLEDARSSLAKFGLESDDVARPLGGLSPGERTRVALAALQIRATNFLVIDEPTNHLDMPAIEQLESALNAYRGALLVVTHDRQFLDNVRFTHTWIVHADGGVRDRS